MMRPLVGPGCGQDGLHDQELGLAARLMRGLQREFPMLICGEIPSPHFSDSDADQRLIIGREKQLSYPFGDATDRSLFIEKRKNDGFLRLQIKQPTAQAVTRPAVAPIPEPTPKPSANGSATKPTISPAVRSRAGRT